MKHSVLIVDDIAFSIDVLRHFVEPYGIRVNYVTSGKEAVDVVREEKVSYSAVFIDQIMPDMDGIQTAHAIRGLGTDYAGTVPLIAVTADASLGGKGEFLSKGFQDFISKPIDISQLDTVICRWVIDKDSTVIHEKPNPLKAAELFNLRIKGINAEHCPKHFGGDEELFIQFLHSFTKNIPGLIEKVKNETRNMKSYAICVHGLKGSCRNICADELSEEAEKLEKAANSGNSDFVYANNEKFLENAERLIENIKKALN
jgi:CheY-like chemotaxis protein